jgi:predicted RNA-binding Zn-ribbon protein involved in translation (DUF1610 family)
VSWKENLVKVWLPKCWGCDIPMEKVTEKMVGKRHKGRFKCPECGAVEVFG